MKRKLLYNENLKFLRKAWYQILLLLIIIAISIPGFSQQLSPSLLCSGGETFVNPNQSLEFAIGEITTETYQSGGNMLTQGFFQGSPAGTDIHENYFTKVDVNIFPNPTKSELNINCNLLPKHICILDLQGRKILDLQKPSRSEKLNIENLQKGIYLLRILFEGNTPVAKRIIKN